MDKAINPFSGRMHSELPDKLKCAIADCIISYSRLETLVIELLWVAWQADLERRKQLAKLRGKQVINSIKEVVALIPGAETDQIWVAFERLNSERNLIGHGVWAVTSEGIPLVVWHSSFLESVDYVGAEYFPWERFDRFVHTIDHLLGTFSEFRAMLEGLAADVNAKNQNQGTKD